MNGLRKNNRGNNSGINQRESDAAEQITTRTPSEQDNARAATGQQRQQSNGENFYFVLDDESSEDDLESFFFKNGVQEEFEVDSEEATKIQGGSQEL